MPAGFGRYRSLSPLLLSFQHEDAVRQSKPNGSLGPGLILLPFDELQAKDAVIEVGAGRKIADLEGDVVEGA